MDMEEGDEVFARMDSLWFYSSVVLLQPSSLQRKQQSKCPDELGPEQQQGSAETHGVSSERSCEAPRCVKEVVTVVATRGRMASTRSCRESGERVGVWLKKQRRQTKVIAMPARCSPVPVPPPDDDGAGAAMKAHLRSWAHAVACSVR